MALYRLYSGTTGLESCVPLDYLDSTHDVESSVRQLCYEVYNAVPDTYILSRDDSDDPDFVVRTYVDDADYRHCVIDQRDDSVLWHERLGISIYNRITHLFSTTPELVFNTVARDLHSRESELLELIRNCRIVVRNQIVRAKNALEELSVVRSRLDNPEELRGWDPVNPVSIDIGRPARVYYDDDGMLCIRWTKCDVVQHDENTNVTGRPGNVRLTLRFGATRAVELRVWSVTHGCTASINASIEGVACLGTALAMLQDAIRRHEWREAAVLSEAWLEHTNSADAYRRWDEAEYPVDGLDELEEEGEG